MSIVLRGVTLTDEQEDLARGLEPAVRMYPYTAAAMIIHLSSMADNAKRIVAGVKNSGFCLHCLSKLTDNICPRCSL